MKNKLNCLKNLWRLSLKIFRNIKYFFINIKTGIKNYWIWKKVIWNDRNYDWVYIFDILKHKMEQVNKEEKSKDIKHLIMVINRIIDEDYINFDHAMKMLTDDPKKYIKYVKYMEDQDMNYLGTILRKHARKWYY